MKKDLRKAVIAGNWKMNNTPAQTTALINEMKPLVAGADCDVVLCVPYVDIAAAVEAAKGSNIKIGAENVHFKASGAYTGEKRGMVIDFGDLKAAVRALADFYDHALIYEAGSLKTATLSALHDEQFRLIEVPYRPTAENFARAFYEELSAEGLPVLRVTVYETPDNCASYEV